MPGWEYIAGQIVTADSGDLELSLPRGQPAREWVLSKGRIALHELGAGGWELAGILPSIGPYEPTAIFKRPLPEL